MLVVIGFNFLNHFYLQKVIWKFQEVRWPRFKEWYGRKLEWALTSSKDFRISNSRTLLLSLFAMIFGRNEFVFFPASDPNFIYAYIKAPIGTDQPKRTALPKLLKVSGKALGPNNPIVTSVITNVAVGTNDANEFDPSVQPHKAKITVAFKKFSDGWHLFQTILDLNP
jgi:multidrug efflux pump